MQYYVIVHTPEILLRHGTGDETIEYKCATFAQNSSMFQKALAHEFHCFMLHYIIDTEFAMLAVQLY